MAIVLYLLVGLSAFMDLALGAWASVFWSSYVSTWRLADVSVSGDPKLLGLVLGLALLFFAVLQGLALYWIRKEKEEGHWILIAFGCYLIVSSLVTFLAFRQRPEFLLVDGLRGALLLVASTFVLRSPATVRELRLPEGKGTDARRGDRVREVERGHERRRRGKGEERRSAGRAESLSARAGRRADERSPSERRSSERRRGRRGSSSGSGGRQGDRFEMESPGRIWSQRSGSAARPQAAESSATGSPMAGSPVGRPPAAPSPAARSPEELIAAEPVLVHRQRRGDTAERPLTVVVKGGPGDLRTRSFADAGELPTDRSEEPRDAEEVDRSDRRRRRRRHRSKPGASGRRGDRPEAGPAVAEDLPEQVHSEFEREEPDSRPSRSSSADHSSGVVEALDMLSLLDPASKRSSPVSGPYGRRQQRTSAVRSGTRQESAPPAAAADRSTDREDPV